MYTYLLVFDQFYLEYIAYYCSLGAFEKRNTIARLLPNVYIRVLVEPSLLLDHYSWALHYRPASKKMPKKHSTIQLIVHTRIQILKHKLL